MDRRDEQEAGALERRIEQLTRQASRALEWIEDGRIEDARSALAQLLASSLSDAEPDAREPAEVAPRESRGWAAPPPPVPSVPLEFEGSVDDDELELAFSEAESDPDEMHDANRVAEQVLEDTDPDEGFEADEHPAFATWTMAQLLEGQGNVAAAAAIRTALHMRAPLADEGQGTSFEAEHATESPAETLEDHDGEQLAARAHTLATLEQWLQNVRRNVA